MPLFIHMTGVSQLYQRLMTVCTLVCALPDAMRHELEAVVWCMQIEQLNAKVQELQTKSWQDSNCRSELDLLKNA